MVDPDEIEIPVEAEAGYYQRARRSIVRIEQQPAYTDPPFDQLEARWAEGTHPDPVPLLADWLALVSDVVARGVTIERVRITADPPTHNQRYMHWISQPNIDAGEQFRYLTLPEAQACGLHPNLGPADWWLFDNTQLMTFDFDTAGRWQRTKVTTNRQRIEQAAKHWALARANSVATPRWAGADAPN